MRPADAMDLLRRRVRRGGLQLNIVMLTGSTVFAQALVILASPVITRVYTPAEYGLFGVYFFLFSVLLAINSLRYEFAIPLSADDDTATNLVALSVALVALTTVLFGILLWLLGDALLAAANATGLRPYLWLLPLALFLGGLFQTLDYWSSRKKRFGQVARARVVQSGGQVATQLGLGLATTGPTGLIAGQIVGLSLSVVMLARGARLVTSAIQPRRWWALLRQYRDFAIYTTWGSLVDILGVQMPTVILSSYYTTQEAGYFSFTMRLLGTPSILIGQAVSRVFYPEMAERKADPARARAFLEQIASFLFVISAPIFAFMIVHGPTLFGIVFGENWRPAGFYAQLLAPWFMIALITSPLSTFTLIMGRQKQGLGFSVMVASLRIGSILIGVRFASAEVAAGIFSAVGVVIYLIYFAWLLRLAESSLWVWLASNAVFIALIVGVVSAGFVITPLLPPLLSMALTLAGLAAVGLRDVPRHWRALNHV